MIVFKSIYRVKVVSRSVFGNSSMIASLIESALNIVVASDLPG